MFRCFADIGWIQLSVGRPERLNPSDDIPVLAKAVYIPGADDAAFFGRSRPEDFAERGEHIICYRKTSGKVSCLPGLNNPDRHGCELDGCEQPAGFGLAITGTIWPVDENGIVDLDWAANAVDQSYNCAVLPAGNDATRAICRYPYAITTGPIQDFSGTVSTVEFDTGVANPSRVIVGSSDYFPYDLPVTFSPSALAATSVTDALAETKPGPNVYVIDDNGDLFFVGYANFSSPLPLGVFHPFGRPAKIDGLDPVVDIVVDQNVAACVLHTSGDVTCWGRWYDESAAERPLKKIRLPYISGATKIAFPIGAGGICWLDNRARLSCALFADTPDGQTLLRTAEPSGPGYD